MCGPQLFLLLALCATKAFAARLKPAQGDAMTSKSCDASHTYAFDARPFVRRCRDLTTGKFAVGGCCSESCAPSLPFQWDAGDQRCLTDIKGNGVFDSPAPTECCAEGCNPSMTYFYNLTVSRCRGSDGRFATTHCCEGGCDATAEFQWDPVSKRCRNMKLGQYANTNCCSEGCAPTLPYAWDSNVQRCRTDINHNGRFDLFAPTACCVEGCASGAPPYAFDTSVKRCRGSDGRFASTQCCA
eukprot:CAMPEP_0169368930 /NCGR_PEP_ID=MMETSP1017-20121227/34515_1 /TAXON_ID=342587 /ORGANISM="Karlodinium micrum, Strain CCMP2283" /LENGTH=241 /DNA_ID=CAMNT_0009467171 /DNA_START=51 /DNA_END=776 /DNA_ORIENTATION=+